MKTVAFLLFLLLWLSGCSGMRTTCPPIPPPRIIEVDRPVPVVVPPPRVDIPSLPRLPIADLDSLSSPSQVARSWEVSALIWMAYTASLKDLLCSVARCDAAPDSLTSPN